MSRGRAWRWPVLALIATLAALIVSFNSGERVALNLGFTMLYRVPLVPLLFVVFLAGMVAMFLVGLRQDLRVRRALREAGFGEATASEPPDASWDAPKPLQSHPLVEPKPSPDPIEEPSGAPVEPRIESPPGNAPDAEPPPRYPP